MLNKNIPKIKNGSLNPIQLKKINHIKEKKNNKKGKK